MPLSKPVKGEYNWDVKLNTALDYLDGKHTISVVSVPANASSTGSIGQIAYNSNYVYICVATNTWVKVSRVAF